MLIATTRCYLIQMLRSALTCANGCSCWSPDEENSPQVFPYHGCALPTELGGPVWDALLGLLGTQLVAMTRRHGTWPGSGLSRRPPATCSGGVGGAGNRSTCHEGVRLRAVWAAGDASDGRGRRAVPGCR